MKNKEVRGLFLCSQNSARSQMAEAKCPIYPWGGLREYWGFDDPAAFVGTPEEQLAEFREVRAQIANRVKAFIEREEA